MTNFNIIFLFLFIFFIQQSITQNPPVVPLTNALTAIYCHNSDEPGIMTIRCGLNEKIRMLDAFDVAVKNKSHLPLQCLKQKHFSMVFSDNSNKSDCKVHTSFISACSGRENCTLHMQRTHLNNPNDNCHNELIDYTMAFFECISDAFIHDVCSSQAITSAWGTLKTPNFPNPYTSNEDCWCKLSTQLQHRLLLSVIVFQLIPYDQKCAGAGLFLQSSNQQRSTQCTYLQQGHNYLSDTNSIYINFYSRTPTVRGGFWIIYEASHPNAEVHLRCGSREKIGIPSETTSSPISVSPPPISSSYNHGWSRLAFNNPPNPTKLTNDHIMHMPLFVTTPRPVLNTNYKMNTVTTAAGAFTYPYGRLTTFELAYGPRGWFLRYPSGSSNMTVTKFLQTTTTEPVVKWNSTWRYIRRPRPRTFTTKSTTTTTTKTTTTTVSTTTQITTLESTTMITSTSISTIITTEENTIPFSSTTLFTTTLQNITAQQRLLFTHKPWIYYSSNSTKSSTTVKPNIKSTLHLSTSSSTLKTAIPSATPWYPPAGLFDWWQWQWYTTKSKKGPLKILSTTQKSAPTTTTIVTTEPTTIVTTESTTIVTTQPTTTKSTIDLSNEISITTITRKNEVTVDWFKWPHIQSTLSTKERPDYYEEHNTEWPDYFATSKIENAITMNPLLYIPLEQQRQQFQQMSFFPTRTNWQFNNRIVTNNTPPSKRHQTQQYTEGVTNVNTQTIIRHNIEQRNKKSSEEYGWLSQTDITIVAVSILFVILLVIINLILFAIRRHRHRLQGRHLYSASCPSSLTNRRIAPNGHLSNTRSADSINGLINTTNNNNNDILPAVGEIVIWDEKDQGGYMIDNHGEWAKIEGRQWFGSNIFKSFSKTASSKSLRSRFQFIRQSNKKSNYRHQQSPIISKTQQQTFKFPLLMDTATLSPVPEADDYQSSELSSSDIIIQNSKTIHKNSNKKHQQSTKTIQALIHKEQDQNGEYYKQIETDGYESNYQAMHGNIQGEYSIADQQTNRSLGNETDAGGSVIITVPTMLRQEDDTGTTTDGGNSIYNQHYSMHSPIENKNMITQRNNLPPNNKNLSATKRSARTHKSSINNSIIVGYCQTDFQTLDPKLFLFKSKDKLSLPEHEQLYSYSQSLDLSTYDSGFFDDQTIDSLTTTNTCDQLDINNLSMKQKHECINMDNISFSKSDNDEDDLSLNCISTTDLRKSNQQQ